VQIQLLAVGNRMPDWVNQGWNEYARRMPAHCALKLTEIAPGRRTKSSDINTIIREEGERIINAIPRDCHVIALEVGGKQWSTLELSKQMEDWQHSGRNTILLVGGPDGLSQDCVARANQKWSLSKLTLPHPLVRVVLAEQLYRAWSVLTGHPYHRE